MWKLLPLLLCLSTELSRSFGLTFVQSHCTFWLSGSLIPCWNPKGNLHTYPQWHRGVGNGRCAFCCHSPAMEKATQWKNTSLKGCGKSMLALICWTGPRELETFLTAAFECCPHLAFHPYSLLGHNLVSRSVLAHTGYAVFPKKKHPSGQKDFVASIITFTWRLLPALLYWLGLEDGLRVKDTLGDRALPEKVLVPYS